MFELRIGPVHLTLEDIRRGHYPRYSLSMHEKSILTLVKSWIEGQEEFEFATSGSTGKPRKIRLHRDQLIASARATLEALNIDRGSTALLCLDTAHIGGAMMVIRSLVADFTLYAVAPSARPLSALPVKDQIELVAVVPYQLRNELMLPGISLDHIGTILLGGAPIDDALGQMVLNIRPAVYHTFGMTETASHFALKRLNGPAPGKTYSVLPGNAISIDKRGCLVVEGPVTRGAKIATNELVQLTGTDSFRWIGRIDDAINTGGIKVYPAEIESIIKSKLAELGLDAEVLVFGAPHPELGEVVCLAIEQRQPVLDAGLVIDQLKKILPRYHVPKKVFRVREFIYTDNGKLRRKATAVQILQQINGPNQ